jgi:hypothetical protein
MRRYVLRTTIFMVGVVAWMAVLSGGAAAAWPDRDERSGCGRRETQGTQVIAKTGAHHRGSISGRVSEDFEPACGMKKAKV